MEFEWSQSDDESELEESHMIKSCFFFFPVDKKVQKLGLGVF